MIRFKLFWGIMIPFETGGYLGLPPDPESIDTSFFFLKNSRLSILVRLKHSDRIVIILWRVLCPSHLGPHSYCISMSSVLIKTHPINGVETIQFIMSCYFTMQPWHEVQPIPSHVCIVKLNIQLLVFWNCSFLLNTSSSFRWRLIITLVP